MRLLILKFCLNPLHNVFDHLQPELVFLQSKLTWRLCEMMSLQIRFS